MREDTTGPVDLRPLSGTRGEARIVQRIYDAAPIFARTTTGEPSRPGAALRTFDMLPDGCGPDAKRMFLITCGGEPVGFVDVIRGFPDAHAAYIGLFVVAEANHGRGIGRRAYRLLERRIAHWPGIGRIELSVLAVNEPALSFWAAMGFAKTGDCTPYAEGSVRSENVFFAKPIRDAS